MALFVDGPANSINDLADQDAGLTGVAQTVGINLSTKLQLAQDEIETDLGLWLHRRETAMEMMWSSRTRMDQVVVTSPLKRWEAMHTLALVYRDAYFSDLVDRYQAKWQEYSKLARSARESLIARGLGIVNDPLRKPEPPALAYITGPQAGGQFYAAISWINASGQESAASDPATIIVPDSNLMTVSALDASANAVGFQVYVGTAPDSMALQNNVVLAIGSSYTYIPGLVTQGAAPGTGQKPDFHRQMARTLLRG